MKQHTQRDSEGVTRMAARYKKTLVLFATILVIVTLYIFWLSRITHSPITNLSHDNTLLVSPVISAPNDLQISQPTAISPNTASLELPQDDRVKLVGQLMDKGLPIQPPFRRIVKQRIKDKSLEQLVKGIGDQWAIPICGIAPEAANPAWLLNTFEGNILVKQLIQQGRKDPERVGAMIASDMNERMSQWYETCQAKRLEALNGSAGAAFGHDGTTVGSSAHIKWLEDGYAIPAEAFVLMNIDYSKGLDALAELAYRIAECGVTRYVGPDGTIWKHMVLGLNYHNPAQQFSNEVVYYAAATLLQHNTDEKYAQFREYIQEQLAGKPAHVEIITDSPDALWPEDGIPLTEYAGIDTSSEPKMMMRMPNEDPAVIKLVTWCIQGSLYTIHKNTMLDTATPVKGEDQPKK